MKTFPNFFKPFTHAQKSFVSLCLLAWWLMAAPTVQAAGPTCTVGASGADYTTIQAAVNDGGCATINVATGTYVENVTINRDVTINGATTGSTIVDGNNAGSVFYITSGTVTLANLTIQHGSGLNRGDGRTFGGGIYNAGTLTVSNSTISGNSTNDSGGGIYNAGTLTVSNSTISGNSTVGVGGGILNGSGSTLTVRNSTLSDNRANYTGGGIYNFNNNTLTLANTILANSPAGRDCVGVNNTTATSQNNWIEDASNACGLVNGVNGNIVGRDPKLGPLQVNAPGNTATHALLAGSPVIDAGDDAVCSAAPVNGLDQRGVVRPQGAHCDIGAYEVEPIVPPIMTVSFTPNGQNDWFTTNPATSRVTADGLASITGINCEGATVSNLVGIGTTSASADVTVTGEGEHTVTCTATDSVGNNGAGPGSQNTGTVKIDATAPTVTLNQADGQSDPTLTSPIHFTVVFAEAVTDFTGSDVTLSGAPGTLVATVTGSDTTYTVAVSGMTGSGTVLATIPAGVAFDAAGHGNIAATSTDNTVLFVVNTPPTANADSYTTAENTGLTLPAPGVLGNDTDADSNTLTAVKVSDPLHGTVTLNADGSFSYLPGAGYNGADSFTYKANDGTADSNVATVAITVNAVNDAPVAVADALTVAEGGTATTLTDGAASVLSNDTDGDGDALTVNLVTGPTNGTLTLNPDGTFSYVHNGSETTSDSFTYRANDGVNDSNPVTVTITITPVNDAPLATNDSYSMNEDTALTMAAPGVLGNDSDAEGNGLAVSGITVASHGSVVMNADGGFTYTPAANYNGPDSFIYKVTDGSTESNLATVNITVNAVNDAPVATDDSYTTAEDTALTVSAPGVLGNDSDGEGSALTASVVALPSHGTLTLNPNGSFSYTPALNYNGTDSFTYQVSDGALTAPVATVTLNVTPVEDLPAYAVDNTDSGYAQIVTIDPFTGSATPFGPRQALDIEDVALHPTTGVLYASTGGNGAKKGWLYRVDRTTGALTAIGQTDGKGVMALTFRSDATLWGWVEGTGLIQIDPATAKATVVTKNTAKFEGMAWASNGKLYLARDKTLTEYNPTSKTFTTYATNLPKGTEALDMLANGRLVGSARDSQITLFSYNLTTKQVTSTKTLSGAAGFSLKSMEGLTWHASLTPPAGF